MNNDDVGPQVNSVAQSHVNSDTTSSTPMKTCWRCGNYFYGPGNECGLTSCSPPPKVCPRCGTVCCTCETTSKEIPTFTVAWKFHENFYDAGLDY